ncbi:voltage-gated potassium channel [Punctularia strigosozonata HHB-11173 SS5]|uniref:voltage-gated potassium channel n=1 Tax=Punctularia strigosozonata (strain HHB-11173) TaxID=741275 RepID=UPI00044169F5|nr:voltage-gated potassium channel [Punctularia strigosozonata HHB-11173 SS5]EIN05813.1 voltage-gated potassium channel [Punctularia strigosozonata HHB-11173 SS5]
MILETTTSRLRSFVRAADWRRRVHSLAVVAPVLAAVLAPLSVLLDIPALSERWYRRDGKTIADPPASLTLSAVGLAFNVIANALLIVRFSLTARASRFATRLSVPFWGLKVATSFANLITFGLLTRNQPTFSYYEGFWCAVVSCILSGVILLLLFLHWWSELGDKRHGRPINHKIHVSGRHYMLHSTYFITLIAIGALVFSRIEHWTYLEGIYFTIVCFLTVGFGDFLPTTAAARVLLFPFALLGIASLASIIEMLIRFFASRSEQRKAKLRAHFEALRERRLAQEGAGDDLAREVAFLERLHHLQDTADQATEVALSFGGFVVFWLVGGAIFWAIEGWPYGTSLYFCYLFFLTIGFGDVVPVTPGGRVVFIVYSLIAVPIMASFAVQTMTSILTRFSSYRLDKQLAALIAVEDAEAASVRDAPIVSHAEFVRRFDRLWEMRRRDASDPGSDASSPDPSRRGASPDSRQAEGEDEAPDVPADKLELADKMVELAVELEAHARRLLIAYLPHGSRMQTLLKADRNIQIRESRPTLDEEKVLSPPPPAEELRDETAMEEVRRYRECFAALLVAGSRLRGLEGEEKYAFERRRASSFS